MISENLSKFGVFWENSKFYEEFHQTDQLIWILNIPENYIILIIQQKFSEF